MRLSPFAAQLRANVWRPQVGMTLVTMDGHPKDRVRSPISLLKVAKSAEVAAKQSRANYVGREKKGRML